jgi:NAD dependent epimerase/dehydratase family
VIVVPVSCLVGHTGFVGGNLARQHSFAHLFNSHNIEEIHGQTYDLIVCCAVPAVKWSANRNPSEDRAGIDRLLANLKTAQAARFILISTMDVYPQTVAVDESCDPHGEPNHPYGANRLYAEDRIRESFARVQIVRLPGLFGPRLKKNTIYDLIHNNDLDRINPNSRLQFYDVRRLWKDLEIVINHDLRLVNFATGPVQCSEIVERYFPGKSIGAHPSPAADYNVRTLYGHWFGDGDAYMYSAQQILSFLGDWIRKETKGAAACSC